MGIPPMHTLNFVGGDAVRFAFQIKDKDLDDPDPASEAVPRDLTGWTAKAHIRKTPASPDVLTEWIIEPLDETGMIHMYLSGAQTRLFIEPKTVSSDVELVDLEGDPQTILRLELKAIQDVTRDD